MVVVAADGRGVFWQQKLKRPVRVEGKINAAIYRDIFDQNPAPELSGPWSGEKLYLQNRTKAQSSQYNKGVL